MDAKDPGKPSAPDEALCGRILDAIISRFQDGEPLPAEAEIRETYPEIADALISRLEMFLHLEDSSFWSPDRRARPSASPADLPEEGPPGYRDVRLLRAGGMGIVYLAEDESLRRTVCLKVLPHWLRESPDALARFEREAEIIARLNHPAIVRIYSKGLWGGGPFFSMEYVRGESLDAAIQSRRSDAAFSGRRAGYVRRCLREILDVCEAIHRAHEAGVVHRDLKPSNLIYDGDRLRVLDFGLALDQSATALTHASHRMGSLPYMSPEQIAGTPVDRRSDIYSLGVTLYEMLTLKRPFEAESAQRLGHLILHQSPPPIRRYNPAIPGDAVAAIEMALEKERERRYATAQAFAEDLGRVLAEKPVRARRIGPITRSYRLLRRHRKVLGISLALATALTLIGLGIGSLLRQARQQAEERRARLEGRAESAIAQCGDLPDDPRPSRQAVIDLLASLDRCEGPVRSRVLRALSAIAASRLRREEARQLHDRAEKEHGIDADEDPAAWEAFHARLVGSLDSSSIASKVKEALRAGSPVPLRAPWPDKGMVSLAGYALCAWDADGDGRKELIVAARESAGKDGEGKDWESRLYSVNLFPEEGEAMCEPLQLESADVGGAALPPFSGAVHLLPGDLDGRPGEELWAICSRFVNWRQNGTFSAWRLTRDGTEGKIRAERFYQYDETLAQSGEVFPNAACIAELPVDAAGRCLPGILIGIHYGERDLSFLAFRGEGRSLERHVLYCPQSDVLSFCVIPARPPEDQPRILVNYGKWRSHETAMLRFDPGLGAYRPEWQRPIGGVKQCCPLWDPKGGDPQDRAILLGNGEEIFNAEVFGRRVPIGPRGFFLLRLDSGPEELILLDRHPEDRILIPVTAARGHVGDGGDVDVCLTVSDCISGSNVEQQEVRLFIVDPSSPEGVSWVPWPIEMPIETRIRAALFVNLDGDASEELVLCGEKLLPYGVDP
ncbi:MAG: serine/threonine protein kinase [Planctomycetes bacterium]|nr:serine/threonine protein kinase [Planctomycetota bacterium]